MLLTLLFSIAMAVVVLIYKDIRKYLNDIRKELRAIESMAYRQERRTVRRL